MQAKSMVSAAMVAGKVSTATARTKSTARVQRHRVRMRKAQCTRLEVTIGTDKAQELRRLAKSKGKEVWELVEIAIDMLKAASGNAK